MFLNVVWMNLGQQHWCYFTFSSQTLSRCSTIDSYLSMACCSEWCDSVSRVALYIARISLLPSPLPILSPPAPTSAADACFASMTLSIHFQKMPSSSRQRSKWLSRSLSLSSNSTFWSTHRNKVEVDEGLTSHQTHYKSNRGRVKWPNQKR